MEKISLSSKNGNPDELCKSPAPNAPSQQDPGQSEAAPSVVSESSDEGEREATKAEKSLIQKLIRTGLYDTAGSLEVKQLDPTSPLYSATSFEDLNLYV